MLQADAVSLERNFNSTLYDIMLLHLCSVLLLLPPIAFQQSLSSSYITLRCYLHCHHRRTQPSGSPFIQLILVYLFRSCFLHSFFSFVGWLVGTAFVVVVVGGGGDGCSSFTSRVLLRALCVVC